MKTGEIKIEQKVGKFSIVPLKVVHPHVQSIDNSCARPTQQLSLGKELEEVRSQGNVSHNTHIIAAAETKKPGQSNRIITKVFFIGRTLSCLSKGSSRLSTKV